MTQIVNNGKASNPRGSDTWSDNLTVNTEASTKEMPPGKNRFFEHLAPKSSSLSAAMRQQNAKFPSDADRTTAKTSLPTPGRENNSVPELRSSRERPLPPGESRLAPRPRSPKESESRLSEKLAVSSRPSGPQQQASNSEMGSGISARRANFPTPLPRTGAALNNETNPNTKDSVESLSAERMSPSSGQSATVTATLPGNELRLPELPTEEWKQRLQMMLATGNPELLMQQSPALALLAGRMEFIEPSQIPALVAQSPLLQQIMGASQSSEALQNSLPIEQNLQMLGLIPQPAAQLGTQVSLLPMALPAEQQTLIKTSDVLHELGFDVPRLTREGDLLKENLSLDGLQTYMQRADRLRANLGVPIEIPLTPAEQSEPTDSMKAEASALSPLLIMPQPGIISAPLGQAVPDQMAAAPRAQEEIVLWSQLPNSKHLTPLAVVDDGTDDPIFFAQSERTVMGLEFAPTLQSMEDLDTALPNTLPPLTGTPLSPLPTTVPQAPLVAQDPFLAMTRSWNPETIQTLRNNDLDSLENLSTSSEQTAHQPLRSLDEILNRHMIQAPDAALQMDAPLPPRESLTLDTNSLQFTLQENALSQDSASRDFSDQNQSQFQNQDQGSLFMQSPSATGIGQKNFSVQMGAAPQAPTPSLSPQNLQDIFDKSSMMIKDGGGSIRIDLGSKETGPLDLAIDIHDKSVELRITAHSDQARDALVQELPKLRESLLNQHLNLEKVEIGLSNSSAWSQSSGNGRQGRDQVVENWQESSSRGPEGIRSSSRSYRQSISQLANERVPLHNGLIQVRV